MSPDRRKHRGPHPADGHLFSDEQVPTLRTAVGELSWLLGRGYAPDSSLKLVGDRYQLTARQRTAIRRAACSDEDSRARKERVVPLAECGPRLEIDGFNVIVSVEAAMSGGVLLLCRDGVVRDLASMHGSYRKVEETVKAIKLIADVLDDEVQDVVWLLDRPVSNAGRLAATLRSHGQTAGRRWDVKLVADVDRQLTRSAHPVASSDSRILDGVDAWVNLTRTIIARMRPRPWIVDLSS